MWPDRDLHRFALQFRKPFLWNPQFGRRTTPEQIRGRRRDDQKIRMKIIQHYPNLISAQLFELRIDQQRLVSRGFDLIKRKQQFERVMRVLAPKIGGPLEGPSRIHKRKLHDAASGNSASTVGDIDALGTDS